MTSAQSAVRFWGLAYALLLLLTGTNLATPLYGLYQERFGFSSITVTVIFAVYVATLIPALLLAGPLSDAVGRRAVLIPAVIVGAVGAVVFLFADSTAMLFVGRAIQGLSIGAASGALTAAIADADPGGNHRRAALVATAASVGGLGLGPLVAGVLAQVTLWPLQAPFVFEVLALVPAMIAVAMIPAHQTKTRWRPTVPGIPVHGRSMFWMSSIASFLAFSVTGLFLALAPTYIQTLIGHRSVLIAGATVALMIAASVVVQIAGSGRITPRSQVPGLIVLAAGLATLAASGQWESLPLLLVATIAAGVGQGMVFLCGLGEITRITPSKQRASVVSAFYVMVYLGVGIPVIGAGALATRVGLLTSVQTFAIVVAVCCLITACVLRPRILDR